MDGISYGNRVGHFNYDKELATVADAILNSTTVASRLLFNGKDFNRSTLLKTVKALRRTQYQQVSGLEPLNSAAENVTIQMQYGRSLASMPLVKILSEAFGRQYDQAVDYDAFEYEDVLDETLQGLSESLLTGAQNVVSLDQITDDGTNYSTIGGVDRTVYTMLKGTLTNFSGVGSLSKLRTMASAISDSGMNENPTVIATTDAVFGLIESLYLPAVRYEYKTLPVGGRYPKAHDAGGMGMGFKILEWNGIPIIRDKAIAAGKMYMLNENYLHWFGDAKTPPSFSKFMKKVSLGSSKVKEGQSEMKPSDYHGFFYQEEQMMPNAGGTIGRIWVSGQLVSFAPKRQGQAYGFTGV